LFSRDLDTFAISTRRDLDEKEKKKVKAVVGHL
jgi:hypothetical protein